MLSRRRNALLGGIRMSREKQHGAGDEALGSKQERIVERLQPLHGSTEFPAMLMAGAAFAPKAAWLRKPLRQRKEKHQPLCSSHMAPEV
jgi:hypothetical protein